MDTGSLPFTILRPVVAPARLSQVTILVRVSDPERELSPIFAGRVAASDPMALDFETRGSEPSGPPDTNYVVGCGLADSRGSLYVDFRESHPSTYEWLMRRLAAENVPLVAHNLMFDGAWPLRDWGLWLNWQHCTYALLRLTATEGWPGQSYSLKSAQKDLLGWPETNERQLDEWLIRNGYSGGVRTAPAEGYHEMANWAGEGETRWVRPDKSQMWRAPADTLGIYCSLDADSTWLLYTQVLLPALERFDALRGFVAPERYADYIRMHLLQKQTGILIDLPKLDTYSRELGQTVTAAREQFFSHPDVAAAIAQWNRRVVAEHAAKEPPRYRKAPPLGAEPARFTKAGKPSKSWEAWDRKRTRPPEESKVWQNWKAKLDELASQSHFNLDSGPQKQWLFYEALGNQVVLETDSGQPAVDEKALGLMGEPGRLLVQYNEGTKELSYVDACRAKVAPDSCVHPGYRIPGTLSGRLSGSGGLSVQQMPKSRGFLECWVARPGTVWVDCDHTALEQVVLTELSRDAGLLRLYGPTAKPNDAYLFTGSQLNVIGPKIRAAGYDPDNPTKEGIAAAKKAAKRERQIAKTVVLACLAGDTEVLTDTGWKRLDSVTLADRVWDGEQWVAHDGLVERGERTVLDFDGVRMTPDHEVLTDGGWEVSERAASAQCVRPRLPRAGWADVWRLACALIRGATGARGVQGSARRMPPPPSWGVEGIR